MMSTLSSSLALKIGASLPPPAPPPPPGFNLNRIFSSTRSCSYNYGRTDLTHHHIPHRPLLCSDSLNPVHGTPHGDNNSLISSHQGSPKDKVETDGRKSLSSKELLEKLRRFGVSGILSYGLLNTAYYLMTFLIVWFYVAPAPGGLGYVAAVERFIKVLAMVWAGSQVTKLVRAAGAVALAPFVERGLSWLTTKLKFKSQGKAFMAIVGFCFALVVLLFFVVTFLWA